mgnify:CR=1 FL=1
MELFSAFGIYSETERKSRSIVAYENYAKRINIEARAMINISGKQLIPAARDAAYHTQIVADMRVLRESADAPETVVDKDLWPLPRYGG